MRTITLQGITKRYQGELIIKDLSLTIPGSTFFALLGPSGSGKTTLLRLLAGLEKPDSGKIFLGDVDITDMQVHQRKINTVFQQYALFPHMDVFDNVAFGLKVKGIAPDLIEQKVLTMLKIVNLEKYVRKPISRLSGGQQQRIALARAIVNEPDVLLLDEPLAALDLKMREKMLIELIDLQDQLQTTFVYVTHDQFEALTVADHMAIMNHHGEIEQVGTPKTIYEFPISTFVAQFVGTNNVLTGTLCHQNDLPAICIKDLGTFSICIQKELEPILLQHKKLFLSIRPEKIEISKVPLEHFSNMVCGIVVAIVYHGRSTQYNVRLANEQVVQVFEQNEEHFTKEIIDYNDLVYLYWQKENAVLLEK